MGYAYPTLPGGCSGCAVFPAGAELSFEFFIARAAPAGSGGLAGLGGSIMISGPLTLAAGGAFI